MRRQRRYQITIVVLTVLHMLFMQLAVAAYVCPASAKTQADFSGMKAMPCDPTSVGLMDREQPNLCHAYCQHAPQSADTAAWPMPLAAGELFALRNWQVPELQLLGIARRAPWLQHSTSPPLIVQNCCFRI